MAIARIFGPCEWRNIFGPCQKYLRQTVHKIGIRHIFSLGIGIAGIDFVISRNWKESAVVAVGFVISAVALSKILTQTKPQENLEEIRKSNQTILEALIPSALEGNNQSLSDLISLYLYAILDRYYKEFLHTSTKAPNLEKLKYPCERIQAQIELAQKNHDAICVSRKKEEIFWWKVHAHLFSLYNKLPKGIFQEPREFLRQITEKQFQESSLEHIRATDVTAFCTFLQELAEEKQSALAIKAQLEQVLRQRNIDPRFILNVRLADFS